MRILLTVILIALCSCDVVHAADFHSVFINSILPHEGGFTMDSAELYSTLSTGRDRLLPKYRHCVAVANLQRYKRTMHILKLEPKKKAGKDLARKERSLGAFERLPPLWSPKGHGSFDGFLEALGTGPYL